MITSINKEMKITELPISSRLRNVLTRHGIIYLKQAAQYPKEVYYKFRNMGEGTYAELEKICNQCNIHIYSHEDLDDEILSVDFSEKQYEQLFYIGIKSKEDIRQIELLELRKILDNKSTIYRKLRKIKIGYVLEGEN